MFEVKSTPRRFDLANELNKFYRGTGFEPAFRVKKTNVPDVYVAARNLADGMCIVIEDDGEIPVYTVYECDAKSITQGINANETLGELEARCRDNSEGHATTFAQTAVDWYYSTVQRL